MLATITALSLIMWVFLDRAKKLWAGVSWGRWLTTGIAVAAGLLLAFGYKMDLLNAFGVCGCITTGGQIFAGLAIAGGSSVLNEIIEKTGAAKA